MSKLPLLTADKVVKTFEKFGWEIARQKGSHIILVQAGHIATLSVPKHREIARGTLRSLIRKADISIDEFIEALHK